MEVSGHEVSVGRSLGWCPDTWLGSPGYRKFPWSAKRPAGRWLGQGDEAGLEQLLGGMSVGRWVLWAGTRENWAGYGFGDRVLLGEHLGRKAVRVGLWEGGAPGGGRRDGRAVKAQPALESGQTVRIDALLPGCPLSRALCPHPGLTCLPAFPAGVHGRGVRRSGCGLGAAPAGRPSTTAVCNIYMKTAREPRRPPRRPGPKTAQVAAHVSCCSCLWGLARASR